MRFNLCGYYWHRKRGTISILRRTEMCNTSLMCDLPLAVDISMHRGSHLDLGARDNAKDSSLGRWQCVQHLQCVTFLQEKVWLRKERMTFTFEGTATYVHFIFDVLVTKDREHCSK